MLARGVKEQRLESSGNGREGCKGWKFEMPSGKQKVFGEGRRVSGVLEQAVLEGWRWGVEMKDGGEDGE